jgi:predicted TIM-barrel fold metal-dependent hydrolase
VLDPFPGIISVDDHLVEPPHLWASRLPAKYQNIGPRVKREKVKVLEHNFTDTQSHHTQESDDGIWVDTWYYEDLREPQGLISAAAGFEKRALENRPITFDQMRPGCFEPQARLSDMDIAGIEASLCFPNITPVRFCGQGFLEAKDKELAELCVHAYNDFMVDEWCAGSNDRLIPCGIIPLWDVEKAAAEVRRNAVRGMHAVTFSEAPAQLGLPSMHTGYWDPFFAACAETSTRLMLHIGSSSKINMPSADAPFGVGNIMQTANAIGTVVDWLYSGIFVRFPELKIVLAECQIGWLPFFLQRIDEVWDQLGYADVRDRVPEPPTTYYRSNVYVTFFDDRFGLHQLDILGFDNVLAETDYPHADSTWPHSQKLMQEQTAHLEPHVTTKIVRDNARKLFDLP